MNKRCPCCNSIRIAPLLSTQIFECQDCGVVGYPVFFEPASTDKIGFTAVEYFVVSWALLFFVLLSYALMSKP